MEVSFNANELELSTVNTTNGSSTISGHSSQLGSDANASLFEDENAKVELRSEEIENTPTDRFGFYVTDKDHSGAQVSIKEIKRLKDKETERVRKWVKMVKKGLFNVDDTKLKRRIKKGIPDIVRAKAWTELARSSDYKRKYPTNLADPVSSIGDVVIDEIDRDLDRTFPRHELFVRRRGEGQSSLRRMLQHYVRLDPETGYCQGMGFIAAMFLTYMPEEDAFYCLTAAMQRPSNPLRDLFKHNFERVQTMLSTFWALLAETFPRLHAHLTTQNLHPSMFATEWFLTVFTRSFPFELVTRVWDVLWADGDWKIVYRVALALLKSVSRALKATDFEGIMRVLKELPSRVHGAAIMEMAWNVPIKRDRIRQLEEFHVYVSANNIS